MPARTVRDYGNIVARLNGIPLLVDQSIAIMDESLESGLDQPRLVVDVVVAQLAAQIRQDGDTTRLLAAFRRFPPNIPQSEQSRLKAQAVEAVPSSLAKVARLPCREVCGQSSPGHRSWFGSRWP
jgi:uncharacterized protein (DUF885 family)